MSSVANRIESILTDEELVLSARGNDARDIRDIADALEIELTVRGNDDQLIDELEAEIALLE